MPAELDKLHKEIHSKLHGKMNPRTKKPYSEDDIWAIAQAQFKKMEGGSMHEKEYKPSYIGQIEIKEEEGEFYSQGFVATTHPDRAQKGKYKGDILTKNSVKKIVDQINAKQGLVANLASYSHDWIKDGDPSLPPAGMAVSAEMREMERGHFGAFVKTHHNKVHPKFNEIKYEVEKGYLPGYSIEYVAGKTSDIHSPDGTFRLIDDLELKGYGFAPARLIANPAATIESFSYKEIMDLPPYVQNTSEVKTMENLPEINETSIDTKDLEDFKKFMEMKTVEKKKEEIAVAVKEALSSILPEVKIKLSEKQAPTSFTSSIEFKEWSGIATENVSVKESFRRATAFATKTGAMDRWWRGGAWNAPVGVESKTVKFNIGSGMYGQQIEVKALETDTNQSTDTDYLQSAAELSDIYAPAITKMLNQKTVYWNLLPKVDFSGKEAITWRAENTANTSSGAYAEGATIVRNQTTRQKLREEFKFYSAGVEVTGQMIESAKSGIGDVFAAEVEAATRALLDTMNTALFGTTGLFTETGFLGLEYIATSTTYTTLYGLTRTAGNALGNANSEFSAQASAAISKPTLRTAIRTLEVNGADRSGFVFVCHPLQRDMVLALLDDAQRFMSPAPRAGFEGLATFDGVPIYTDFRVNTDDIFLVNLGENGMRIGVQVPVRYEDLAKTSDNRAGFLKFYGNQYALAPRQALYMIQGLATS